MSSRADHTPNTAPIRFEVLFSGHVQGVGFRYRTCRVAQDHAVTGYVMNRDDGRVQIVAEGDRPAVVRFLEDVRRTLADHIRAVEQQECAASGQWQAFTIRQ